MNLRTTHTSDAAEVMGALAVLACVGWLYSKAILER